MTITEEEKIQIARKEIEAAIGLGYNRYVYPCQAVWNKWLNDPRIRKMNLQCAQQYIHNKERKMRLQNNG